MDLNQLNEEFIQNEFKNKWNHLFESIKQREDEFDSECNVALLEQNRAYNRYRNILPYDHSRIILKDCEETDYINANLVEYKEADAKYLLTQGPKTSTCEHFWHMVWQERPKGIIMLNKIIEAGSRKCEPYFPSLDDEDDELTKHYGNFEIDFLDESILRTYAYTIRKLSVTNLKLNEQLDVYHLQYLNWPDFEEPDGSFLEFLNECHKLNLFHDANYGPPIIHCSAGIGRSGTFILVNTCLELYKKYENKLPHSILDVLLQLRTYRRGLVQTPNQLKFAYQTIIEGIEQMQNEESKKEHPSESYNSIIADTDDDDDNILDLNDIEIKDSKMELLNLDSNINADNFELKMNLNEAQQPINNDNQQISDNLPKIIDNTLNEDLNENKNQIQHINDEIKSIKNEILSGIDAESLSSSDSDEILLKRSDRDVSTVKVNVPRQPLEQTVNNKETDEKQEEINLSEDEAAKLHALIQQNQYKKSNEILKPPTHAAPSLPTMIPTTKNESKLSDDFDIISQTPIDLPKTPPSTPVKSPILFENPINSNQQKTQSFESFRKLNQSSPINDYVNKANLTSIIDQQPNQSSIIQNRKSSTNDKQQRITNLVHTIKEKQIKHENEINNRFIFRYRPYLISGGFLIASFLAIKLYRSFFTNN